MTSNPNEEPDPSKVPAPEKTRAKQGNLEFEFPSAGARPAREPASKPRPSPNRPSNWNSTFSEQRASTSSQPSNPEASAPKPMSNTFSQYQQNVQRQAKEQKAVGSVLSSAAIILAAFILIVGILAGFGGWVLWRAIQNQSTTVAQLQTKMENEVILLKTTIKEDEVVLETLTNQARVQKEQSAALGNQIDDLRSQFKKSAVADAQKLKKLENRIYDLERQAVPR